jgi:PAS domain S-box-containing protein
MKPRKCMEVSARNPMVHKNEMDRTLLETILEGTASTTGQEFLTALVHSLAQALRVDGAWVTEYLQEPNRLRAYSFWLRDHYVPEYEYDVYGTPCEAALQHKGLVHFPENVIQLFPLDPDLAPLNAVGYMGMPILDTDEKILGHLAVLDSKPLPEDPQLEAVFRLFALKASAELRRLRAESRVRLSEERFSGLFQSAMDAIVELDEAFNICRANPSAVKTFGMNAGEAEAQSFLRFLTPGSAKKLRMLIRNLGSNAPQSVWVAGGLEGLRSDGVTFPAEASLSRFQVQREFHFTLILRDIRTQIEAERTIAALTSESAYLQEEIGGIYNFGEILGRSRPCQEMLNRIHQVAPAEATVLIEGETGTGKELVARAIHRAGRRSTKPLIKVNCAAIPASLVESEFFGHEKGAFTGATQRRIGRFGLADGGTIFLDEIGELSLDLQSKLLRVLQEGEFEPVGSSQTRKVNVRVIAATNRDLQAEIRAGRFREDLYYRLNVFPIHVPPLRERMEDVGILAESFVRMFCSKAGRDVLQLTPDSIRRLRAYHWPGNVRELQNIIERAVILSRGTALTLDETLPATAAPAAANTEKPAGLYERSIPQTDKELRELETATIVQALERCGWKISGEAGAARMLGLPPSTLSSRMKALGIRRPRL